MLVILRLSSTQCKEIRKQTVHIVGLCQIVAMLYNVRTKTFSFRKHVTVKRGNTLQQHLCHGSNTHCCVYSRNTVYSWVLLWLNGGGIHTHAKYWNVPFTQSAWNSQAAVDAGEIVLLYSGWRHPSTTVLNECSRISQRYFWMEVTHEFYRH
jgi:hypothetical protein